MTNDIKWAGNRFKGQHKSAIDFLSKNEIAKVRNFHASLPDYQATPLHRLDDLAKQFGVGGIYVKDESFRFGLNAFKALGASYAIGRWLTDRLGSDTKTVSFKELSSLASDNKFTEVTFTTATDGNHGRGVAWTARQLGQKAVVYMPEGSSTFRVENIRGEDAEVYITDCNYDDTVRMAADNAAKNGWVVVQDTAWPGYEDIPLYIMQGYATIAAECVEQLNSLGIEKPTHIFVQAGVGSFAAAIQGYFTAAFGEERPKTIVVEADQAACLLKLAEARDGQPQAVGGSLTTIMAGLACGEANYIAWNILRDYSDMFFACPDWVAARGMRILGSPVGEDSRVISGESGAVTTGLLSVLLKDSRLQAVRETLSLNQESRVLLISTEGDTDPEQYRRIVWDGEYSSPGVD